MLLLWGSFLCSICGQWFRCMLGYSCSIILWKVMGASRGMNNTMWRYGLTENRPAAMSGRCRGEALRYVATRRVTSRTGVVTGSANRENKVCFLVKNANKWPVFWCTVNWARARLKTALIAVGAQWSSSFYAAGVRECAAAAVGSSVLQASGDDTVKLNTDQSLDKTPQRNWFPEAFCD